MIAFDTDVLVELLKGNAVCVARASRVAREEQFVPSVVIEEVMRGRLNAIRRAESGKIKLSVDRAYALFEETFRDFRTRRILPYTAQAEAQFHAWREANVRVATHDLRIAATCVVHATKLITRNRKDFDQIPGVNVEYWT
jgi:tRNA(fMet)-specific endonuclease VapC